MEEMNIEAVEIHMDDIVYMSVSLDEETYEALGRIMAHYGVTDHGEMIRRIIDKMDAYLQETEEGYI